MNKAWDAVLPARAIWAEVLRVLKPGASCFVCAGSRQDTILGLLTDLREVGFDIQHAALTWTYATGFPKSTDVGKDIDKAAFLAWLREVPPGETETRQALMGWDAADVRKAASAAVNGEAMPASHRTLKEGSNYEAAVPIGSACLGASARSHGTRLLTALQARFGDAPGVRQKVGEYVAPDGNGRDSDASIRGGNWGNTAGQREAALSTITSPATPEAVEWDGWHSGSVPLKPSSETVLWVTKPAEPGPARLNVLKWGTGACNIGECRMPFDGADSPAASRWGGLRDTEPTQPRAAFTDDSGGGPSNCTSTTGARYPSNLLVSSRALGDDSKYGDLEAWAAARGLSPEWLDVALSAGVLRVAKPSRSEKNAGCEGLEEKSRPAPVAAQRVKCRSCGKWQGHANGNRPTSYCTCQNPEWEELGEVPRANGHPTCKPVTLMAFLCVLACPRGGTVLDPFLGSGTTAVAAVQCGIHFIGIEKEPEYVQIAEARVAHALEQTRLGGLFAEVEAAE